MGYHHKIIENVIKPLSVKHDYYNLMKFNFVLLIFHRDLGCVFLTIFKVEVVPCRCLRSLVVFSVSLTKQSTLNISVSLLK